MVRKEVAYPLYFMSLIQDQTLADKGFYGELMKWNSGQTLVVKTHGFTSGTVRACPSCRKVYLINCIPGLKPFLLLPAAAGVQPHGQADRQGHLVDQEPSQHAHQPEEPGLWGSFWLCKATYVQGDTMYNPTVFLQCCFLEVIASLLVMFSLTHSVRDVLSNLTAYL